jgi:MoaA/NifB/PqqE/SkfB family radical SAM enzyme
MMNEYFFYIDVVGGCNLKCPSCPVGNSRGVDRPKGLMDAALLDLIMKKAVGECKISGVGLFNWTEPLLHPRVSELVRVIRSYNVPCSISTNLSIKKTSFDDLLATNLEAIYVTTSGFTPEIYCQTHTGGNIQLVKNNMRQLAETKEKLSSPTVITVIFLRYKSNLHEEKLMQNYADELGFKFMPLNARMLPLEKVLSYVSNDSELPRLTQNDFALMDLLMMPVDQAMNIARHNSKQICNSLTKQFSINLLGNVELCCNVFDSSKYTICNFLDMPINQIQKIRSSHSMCNKCVGQGGHVYFGPSDVSELV